MVGLRIHPLKVAILEALLRIGQPLSASELAQILKAPDSRFDHVNYHLKALSELDVCEPVHKRRVRGTWETYYFLRDEFVEVGQADD